VRASLFLGIVILGQPAECSESFFTALNAASFAIKDLRYAVGQLLGPVDIICLGILVVERADAIVWKWSVLVRSEQKYLVTSSRHGWDHEG
jgi:hypothetical protein